MAELLKFPDIGRPKLPTASNSGSSHLVSVQDSTIATTSDAGYKHTRPRTTRMIRTYTFTWNAVPEELMKKLLEETHTVRFSEPLSYQYSYPGYRFTLKFEEV